MVQPDLSMTQDVLTTPPWPPNVPVPGPPSGPAGGDLTGMYPNPTIAPGVIPTTLPPMGPAGGDLNGTYPNPLVDGLNGAPVGTTTPLARGDLLVAQTATPTFARLALGAATMQLQSNGTDAVWGYPLAGPPSGPAGGALTGTYPNPGVTYSAITGTPTSLPPSGPASGDLQGTYPSPSLTVAAKSKWSESAGTLTPVNASDLVTVQTLSVGGAGGTNPGWITLASASSRTAKGRVDSGLAGAAGTFAGISINRNTATGGVDDTSQSGWKMYLDNSLDAACIARNPSGNANLANFFTLDYIGRLFLPGDVNAQAGVVLGAQSPKVRIQTPNGGPPLRATFTINRDIVSGTVDDNTKPLWQFEMNATTDLVTIQHAPAGAGSNTNFVTVDNAGNLTIFGPTATKASGTTWANPSDGRLKKNVAPYTQGTAAIVALNPITFDYNGLGGSTDGMPGIGLIAEDVQPVMPEMIGTRMGKLNPDDPEETEILTLDTTALQLALVNAVKELDARVSALEKNKP